MISTGRPTPAAIGAVATADYGTPTNIEAQAGGSYGASWGSNAGGAVVGIQSCNEPVGYTSLQGSAKVTTAIVASGGTLFTLPAASHPATMFSFVTRFLGSGAAALVLTFNTDGTVTYPSSSIALGDTVDFTGLRFKHA